MKNILSIDGGGVRCYMPLRLLCEIEKRTNTPICNLFDYFTGVSASSLILGLLLVKNQDGTPKFTTSKILQEFKENCKNIFYYSYFDLVKTGWGWLAPKYSNSKFQKILQDNFGKTCLGELLKPICILTYDLNHEYSCYFNNNENGFLEISQCILCSTAAPTYFYPYNYNYDNVDHAFIDGGVITNNPAELCFIKASEHYKHDNFYTISIGTGYTFEKKANSVFSYGLLGWSKNIINTLFDANSSAQITELNMLDIIVKREKQKNSLNRIDFELEKDINLDDVEAFNMMEKIMDKWIENNNELINKLCNKLLENYHSQSNNSIL